jgi:nucleoside-triphosphatase
MSIIFFSGDRQSGKTTKLFDWCKDKNNIAGILMPDINNERVLYNIEEKSNINPPKDVSNTDLPEYISIGNFHFLKTSFLKSNQIIETAIKEQREIVVVDEFGKLELNKQGFYPAVLFAVNAIKQQTYSGKLILTVRDIYIDKVIDLLEIDKPKIVYDTNQLSNLYNI